MSLVGAGQYNYYHWWMDILPRFHLLQTCGRLPDNPVYYAESTLPFQRDTLQFLGIPEERLLNSKNFQTLRCREIWAASPKSPARKPDLWAVAWLRKTFRSMGVVPVKSSPCVIVSRRHAKNRNILNEDEMIQALSLMNPVVVELEKMSVAEQIGLFAQARCVIAPHGAGLTNMLFVPEDCHVIELFGNEQTNDCYPLIASAMGIRHSVLLGKNVIDPHTGLVNINVDPTQIVEAAMDA